MAKNIYFDGEEFQYEGHTFKVEFPNDSDRGAPWEECDGHGPVSDWTTRDKAPGERVLNSVRYRKRYYDFAAANQIAKRDGWGLSPDNRAELARKIGREPTAGEIRAEAVNRDYEYLRRWCNDNWSYVGVVVTHVATDKESSIWGIESDAYEYLTETAHECAAEIMRELKRDADNARGQLKELGQQLRALIADIRESSAIRPAVCDALRAHISVLMAKRRDQWRALEALAS